MEVEGEQGSGPKEVDAITHKENFLLLLLLPFPSLEAQIPVLRPKSLKAVIWAFGLVFGP